MGIVPIITPFRIIMLVGERGREKRREKLISNLVTLLVTPVVIALTEGLVSQNQRRKVVLIMPHPVVVMDQHDLV